MKFDSIYSFMESSFLESSNLLQSGLVALQVCYSIINQKSFYTVILEFSLPPLPPEALFSGSSLCLLVHFLVLMEYI